MARKHLNNFKNNMNNNWESSQQLLNISETFYSVQAEGLTTGIPARFIRLKGCNLSCGISKKHLSQIQIAGKGNTPSGGFIGDLHQQGVATWTCDSAPVWLFGDKRTYESLYDELANNIMANGQSELDWISRGRVHIIWTGGEPTLPIHQKAIVGWLKYAKQRYEAQTGKVFSPHNEIETNGTVAISLELLKELYLITCSAKLANSGMDAGVRISEAAIDTIVSARRPKAYGKQFEGMSQLFPMFQFKFVVSTEQDLINAFEEYIDPFGIPPHNIVIMPGLDNQADFHERTRFVLELAKKYGIRGLTRLHISAWNQATGV